MKRRSWYILQGRFKGSTLEPQQATKRLKKGIGQMLTWSSIRISQATVTELLLRVLHSKQFHYSLQLILHLLPPRRSQASKSESLLPHSRAILALAVIVAENNPNGYYLKV